MRTTKLILLILLFQIQGLVLAQMSMGNLPSYVLPSPISQEYQKYLGYPVSHSTGIPEINIPLYDLNISGYSIPFSLNYHAGGIKVEQSPYPIGYGWSLFPACRVVRTLLNKPDESYLLSSEKILSYSSIDRVKNLDFLADLAPTQSTDLACLELKDAQHDIFSIFLPHQTGYFILKRDSNNLKAITISEIPLKIEVRMSGSLLEGFEVTDDKGIIYQIGAYDPSMRKSYIENSPTVLGDVGTSWLLYKIILPGINNEITFKYKNPYNMDINPLLTKWSELHIYDQLSSVDDYGRFRLNSSAAVYSYETKDVYGPRTGTTYSNLLSTITFPSGEIKLNYIAERELSSFHVFDKNQKNIKTIDFHRNSNDPYLLSKLEIGREIYTFRYNGQRFKKATAQDYWGYYNGQVDNYSLIPKIKVSLGATNFTPLLGDANREASDTCMKANILEKIIYPTGGHTEFIYEPNMYRDYAGIEQIMGGLRIKEMKIVDSLSNNTINKRYLYGNNEDGVGNTTLIITPAHFLKEHILWQPSGSYYYGFIDAAHVRRRTVCEYPTCTIFTMLNSLIWYSKVTEYNSEGKTEYNFNYIPDEYNGSGVTYSSEYETNAFPISDFYSLIYSTPFPTKICIYKLEKSIFKLLNETIYDYSIHFKESIKGIIVEPYAMNTVNSNSDLRCRIKDSSWTWNLPRNLFDNISFYSYFNYSIYRGSLLLNKVIKNDYTPQEKIQTNITYKYDSSNLFNLISTTESNSKLGFNSIKYYYATNPVSGESQILKNNRILLTEKNRLTTPIRTEWYENDKLSKAEQYIYADWGNRSIKLKESQFEKAGYNIETRLQYHNYDTYGNPLYISKDNADRVVYLWGYNYQYPIAEIKNATYDEVKSAISGNEPTINTLAVSNNPDMTKVDALRASLPNALVTTYTYKPLVGVETMTDPRGVKTRYEYDSFGRLIAVKDHNSNVIESSTYHYQNQ